MIVILRLFVEMQRYEIHGLPTIRFPYLINSASEVAPNRPIDFDVCKNEAGNKFFPRNFETLNNLRFYILLFCHLTVNCGYGFIVI